MTAPVKTPPPAARAPQGDALYERDFAAWCDAQATAIERGQFASVDRTHVAEELRDLGREQFNALSSALMVVVKHLLKWDRQPDRRTRSWVVSIRSLRAEAAKRLRQNPSLRSRIDEAIADAYERARIEAAGETGLPERTFPAECPYSFEDMMERDVSWPED